MQGITGVTARMAEIQGRFAAMAAMEPGAAAARAEAAAATRTATAGTSTTSTSATSFANVFSEALSAAKPAPATKTSYKLNKDGVPTDLAVYGNGKVPKNQLERIGDSGHRLWAPAAQQLEKMLADAKRDGVKIGITDSYRSYAEQVDLVRRKGLYSQGGLAAKPGTSDHGWGMAVDLNLNGKALAWMRQNGEKYGFEEDTPREPWHWGFKVNKVKG